MQWARVLAPTTGGEADSRVLAAAAALGAPFEAEVACVFAPPDMADMMPWMSDGFMGAGQTGAMEGIRSAIAEGRAAAQAAFEGLTYARKQFIELDSPVWAGLAMEGRLSDVVVFDDLSGRGKGALAQSFQQMVADEQRPTVVARAGLAVGGVVAVAWDGGKEASRAARTALPLLARASKVVVLAAPDAAERSFDPERLAAFLTARGAAACVQILPDASDPATGLLAAAKALGAGLLVAGAYGHSRLREFIFGGATHTFLAGDGPSLFLSH